MDAKIVSLKLDVLADDDIALIRASYTDSLSSPFTIDVELAVLLTKFKPVEDFIGTELKIELELRDGDKRYFSGEIFSASYFEADEKEVKLNLVANPKLELLRYAQDCKVFQNMNTEEIVRQVFEKHRFSDVTFDLQGSLQPREYCVQYRESDFDFVHRLLDEEGIYYFFEHGRSGYKMKLVNAMLSHESFAGYREIEFHALSDDVPDEHIWALSHSAEQNTTQASLDDFDYEKYRTDLSGTNMGQKLGEEQDAEVYDWPGQYKVASQGDKRAKLLLEGLRANGRQIAGNANARGLCCGYKFKLQSHPVESDNRDYLITSTCVDMEGEAMTSGAGAVDTPLTCQFNAVPDDVDFRVTGRYHKRLSPGPQTATVVGKSGEEIDTDKYGRIKVQFHWDREGQSNENSSCWLRVCQIWAGSGWGGMFIPRIGQEVLVDFIEGDPDRPIVVGSVYNDTKLPPWSLPGEKTKSGVKTDSSPGSGNDNELSFDDKSGEEKIYLHAAKDFESLVENERHATVEKDATETLKNNYKVEVTKNIDISSDAKITIEAANQMTLKVGGSEVKITPSEISIKSTQIKVSGSAQVKVDAATTEVAGSGMLTLKGGLVKIN